MDFFANLIAGFSVALQPINLMFCFLGVFIGTLIGVLPGIGPVGTMAILLPVTYGIPPTTAIIMLAGIYYGAQYGGSTTSILVNIPGEAASVVTYPGRLPDGLERPGRPGPGDRGLRLLHRRDLWGHWLTASGPALGLCGFTLRPPRILLLDDPRLCDPYLSGPEVDGQSPDDGRRRNPPGNDRAGHDDGDAPFHLQHSRTARRRGTRAAGHGSLRHLGNPAERGKEDQAGTPHHQGQGTLPDFGGLETVPGAHSPGYWSPAFSWVSYPAGGRSSAPSCPMPWRSVSPSIPKNSARGPSKEWQPRRRPTTPPPREPSSPS